LRCAPSGLRLLRVEATVAGVGKSEARTTFAGTTNPGLRCAPSGLRLLRVEATVAGVGESEARTTFAGTTDPGLRFRLR